MKFVMRNAELLKNTAGIKSDDEKGRIEVKRCRTP